MANINVLDQEGKEKEKFEISDEIIKQKMNDELLHQEVRRYLASGRAGTHKVKQRGEVSGGGKKPWRQKGTGNARAGTNRSPIWRHGGITFGPTPRDYSFKLNKKVIRKSRLIALSEKYKSKRLMILDTLEFDEAKTKNAQQLLDRFELSGKKILIVLDGIGSNVERAFRNIPGIVLVNPRGINTYDILVADHIVFTKKSLTDFIKGLDNERS